MRISLRFKFTLALLLTSLSAVALVGVGARWMLLRDFSDILLEDSFSRYRINMTAYIKTHGSLEQALRTEEFGEFQRRQDAALSAYRGSPPVWSSFRPSEYAAGAPPVPGDPSLGGPIGMGPQAGMDVPPPPPGEGYGEPAGDLQGGGPGAPPMGRRPPENDRAAPPFKFLLLSPEGTVLGGDPAYAKGTRAPASLREKAKPIVVNGKLAALAVPLARPNLNGMDKAYLRAVSQALVYAGGAAALLTLLLGVALGSRLSGELRRLTHAVERMGKGQLLQRVDVGSSDEVGVLAEAFNRMSVDLARAHDDLQQSAAQVREQAARMQELSMRDALTGLYNRRHFDEYVKQAFAQAVRYRQPLTVMLGDLDYFKRINDQFSHAVGDEVLRRVGHLLRTHMRESDVVARYGGEEFVIAFTQTALPQALLACEKLRLAIEAHPWHEVAAGLQVTMSMGLSDDLGVLNADKMLAAADACLYAVKETGRNRVFGEAPKSDGAESVVT